ncbi:1-acyl-sn-glycerol-3-phosphate acyltransferase [Sanguibacter antarcticus]|uniref:1-acyl-sn-glycerol-3-phosphate acyltransferase n=2 Tax=Sanguibacter antarcticus TaxID=372484 RepID=A0A2A9E229_9MICO|nr:lysophospholipid acyltransferase family protein [Sanguibacter antarcticus]PFG32706.1 1-acyl-sn-glycerol-3-phosphate acyltransferase [Sanguibacter antarcticus]
MPTGAGKNLTYRTVAGVIKPFLWAVAKRDWRGVENFPTSGGFIVAANHMTNLDPLTFAQFVYDTARAPRILAKASLWKIPVLRWVLDSTGMIPVHRNTVGAASSLADAVRALELGECVAVFPEGTLTRDPNLWPMTGKTGAARLALSSGVPVIPVAQWGPQDILGQYSKRLRPFPRKRVTIRAGRPVDLSDLLGRPQDTSVLREATERIMVAITELLEEIRGESAPEVRFDMRRTAVAGEQVEAVADAGDAPAVLDVDGDAAADTDTERPTQ